MNIKINYHSSISINDKIFIDPLKIDENYKAEYIFITHPHWDHFSVEDIKKIITSNTKIICPRSMQNDINGIFENEILFVEPDKRYEIGDIKFETFYSYNIGKPFHPKENLWVGYNIELEGQKIAVVGDSDNTIELQKLKTDILLVPIGGHYTMDANEASALVNMIKPKKVIPTHYGDVVGTKQMADEFVEMLSENISCEILLK